MAGQEIHSEIQTYYTSDGLLARLDAAVAAAGRDPQALTLSDTETIDQFHVGGKPATLELARRAGVSAGWQVLDVGGGIGGPARTLAAEVGCHVTVLDLTAEYCVMGEELTRRVGMADRLQFRQGDALLMPFASDSFDLVWTQHATMNIPDKPRLFAEAARVLRSGGRLAVHEIMAGPVQPVHYPAPWAASPATSFLLSPDDFRAAAVAAGFHEVSWEQLPPPPPEMLLRLAALSPAGLPHLIALGVGADAARERLQNVARNLHEQRVALAMGVFVKG